MKPVSVALPEFWESYAVSPPEVQIQADKKYAIFAENPSHPSLRPKQDGLYCWCWIGPHDEYEMLISD